MSATTLAEPPPTDAANAAASWSIDAVIDNRAIRTLFQPVIHLASKSTVGFEALTRGPAGSSLESPLALLDAAGLAGRLGELDWLCRAQAMDAAAHAGLPDTLSWLINVEPAGLAMDCPAALIPTVQRARHDLRVILEVVERGLHGNVLELLQATDQARQDSWGVALDDVGAEEASLALLPLLSPDLIKLDMSLVRNLPNAQASATTAAVRAYAERTGAVILAEGIETEEQERLARVFGATYAQGYYYGRPGPLPASLAPPSHPIPLGQHLAPLDGRTPFEVLSTTCEPQREHKERLLHITAHLERQAGRASHASILLSGFRNQSLFTPAVQSRYRRLSATNALTIVLARDLPERDEPTYYVGPLPDGSGMAQEWVVIVLNVDYAAAFVARDCGDTGSDGQRRFDFIYTHDKAAVVNAARCFIQNLGPIHAASESRSVNAGKTSRSGTRTSTALTGKEFNEPVRTISTDAAGTAVAETDAGTGTDVGFPAASQLVLNYLNTAMPMAFWSVTRVENDRQTYLYLDDNDYGLSVGMSHPWQDSYCMHMVAGTAPRLAPDSAVIPEYAAAAVNRAVQIGAYAGAPITEPGGALFGAICGLDRVPRADLAHFGPMLNVLSELLTLALASDRALSEAEYSSRTALTYATTDSLTGIHNHRSWENRIAELDLEFSAHADPTVIVVVDLDNLKTVNDGPGGHRAGDQLLRNAADVMRRHIRERDFLARLGGDEFGIILTGCPQVQAPALLRRLNRALERAAIPASAGWSALCPGVTVQHAIEMADHAMYHVKQARRTAKTRAS